MTDPSIVAQGYDAVYDAMPRSPTLLRLWKQLVAGDDYPDDFYHISFITLPDLRHLARALNLSPGARFSDIACGMGGPALWIARETGAHLYGVDLSPVAVAQAEKRAQDLGLAGTSHFSIGSFAETGLETTSMDAAMSVDALQYEQTPNWHDRLFTAYSAVIDAREALREEMGEPATAAILSEMALTVERDIYCGRVFAVAERK